LKEADIERLKKEQKPLPANWRSRLVQLKQKRGHKENQLLVSGANGSAFRIIVRQSDTNPLDFSAILACVLPDSNKSFILRRYNGKSHEHTNPLEAKTFYDYHIHEITERYQDSPHKDETFARPTDRYSNLAEAIDCLIIDCGFELPSEPQRRLFR